MLALVIAIAALLLIPLLIGYELRRRAHPPVRMKGPIPPRRLVYLEDRVREALEHTKQQFGDIFISYRVWKINQETRLELEATPKWKRLSAFTRCLIVRHLWRSLEAVASGTVVVVDDPEQQWTKDINTAFWDRGVDPWRAHPLYAAGRASRFS